MHFEINALNAWRKEESLFCLYDLEFFIDWEAGSGWVSIGLFGFAFQFIFHWKH